MRITEGWARLINADCHAWVAASVHLGRVIKQLDQDLLM